MDEAWVCAGCHSINLARAGRCYHCHLRRGESASPAPEPNVLREPSGEVAVLREPLDDAEAMRPVSRAGGGIAPGSVEGAAGGDVSSAPGPGPAASEPAAEWPLSPDSAASQPAAAPPQEAPGWPPGPTESPSPSAPASPSQSATPWPLQAAIVPPGSGRSRRRATLLAGLAVLVAGAVLAWSVAFVPGWLGPGASASPLASGALASGSPVGSSATASLGSPAASPGASASAAPTSGARIPGGAIGGTWLSRITLVPSGSVDLTGQVPFQDRILDIEPGCATEPCPSAKLRIYFLNDPQFVYEATLQRSGDTYRSSPAAAGSVPCLTSSGNQVPSGATVTRTISAWRERVRTPGTAVTSEQVRGEIRYDATPTKVGDLAGCSAWSAIYQVSAEDRWSVPTLPPSPSPEPTPPPGSALVTLPVLTYPIAGARVEYFPVAGSTASSLLDSLPRNGVKACGEIQYDWYEGDPRPVGCVLPSWNQGALVPLVDAAGACRIGVNGSALSYTVELPQWTQPRFVPRPLLTWWQRILTFIGAHEATHIQIFQRYAAMLPGRLAGLDCIQAPAAVNVWAHELQAAQAAFDKAEYAKPWPTPPPGY